MSKEYSFPIEEVHSMFIECSCSKAKLVELLKGSTFTKFNELEDLALKFGTESDAYKYLLKTKGYEEILRRKKFLGI